MAWAPVEELPNALAQLGSTIAEYRLDRERKFWRYVFAFLLSAAGAALIYWVVSLAIEHNRVWIGLFVVFAIGSLMVIGGLWKCCKEWDRGANRTFVLDKGLVVAKRTQFIALPWNQVEEVRQKVVDRYRQVFLFYRVHMETTQAFAVHGSDGTRLTFNDQMKDVGALGDAIQKAVTPRLLARAWEELAAGNSVIFGDLTVTPEGLHQETGFLSWQDVADIRVDQGAVSIDKKGKVFAWLKITTAEVPNLFVFLSLIQKLSSHRASIGNPDQQIQ